MEIKNFLFSLNNEECISKIKVLGKNFFKNTQLTVPGSKSFSNRAIALAGMSGIPVTLEGVLFSEDSYWGMNSLIKLGFSLEINYQLKIVHIVPPQNNFLNEQNLYFGKAGTLARFFPSVILNWQKTFPRSKELKSHVYADKQLMNRPLTPLIHALKSLNANIEGESLPLSLISSDLKGKCSISGAVSGQFLSGLLLAAHGAKNKIVIERIERLVQPDYVRMTMQIIKDFGGYIHCNNNLTLFEIQKTENKIDAFSYCIEADASTCCYFLALAFLHNFNLRILNLGKNTLQPDLKFISVLIEMGAHIEILDSEIMVYKREFNLKPKGNRIFDFSYFSDQALTLGALGLFADAPIEIIGISHIRKHECDRIACFVKNILSLDLNIEEKKDGFIIYPCQRNLNSINGEFETWEDHRFVMSGFIIASMAKNVVIKNPKCVEKTAPQFFNQVQELGFQLEIV
ncbi:3-phosphoshikimate 1-carboxyvinyltransferase [Silvanigrella aquatica]|uniref:3-phosphoshikimate 1-carboxyvinyltransferase n=1 Tax=Silvanigrella aquatica TaxID=1915309 RepID=A0A1L4D0A0_9BACT|nr:3-phosphoshikimate 1-carboxyvinyltransferase [Silvanigrella aquatica]APJ03626.1 3-phosphoshikimate 1-carboxyvinyltransferase [Silvanigrella aquatica]